MSDEEKKAIEVIKGLAVYYDDYSLLDKEEIEENEEVNNSINIIINLIEKQSKEIEELKETLKCTQNSWYEDTKVIEKQFKEIEELKKYEKYYEEMEEVNKRFIAVDKIKAKIEEVSNGTFDAKIVLQSLLEKE